MKVKLTAEDRTDDIRVEVENERELQKRQAEYEKKAYVHREKVEAKLFNAPAIELIDKAGWQKFKEVSINGYGNAIATYSERWARLMQIEMVNGKKLEDVADSTSLDAGLEDITTFMYRCAILQLATYWRYGDQLRRWYNIKTQIGNES